MKKLCEEKGICDGVTEFRLANNWSKKKSLKRKADRKQKDEMSYEVDYIVDHRMGSIRHCTVEYFVHFKGYTISERQWIDERYIDAEEAIKAYKWILIKEIQMRHQ